MELWLPWLFLLAGIVVTGVTVRAAFSGRLKRKLSRAAAALISFPLFLLSLFAVLMIGCQSNGPLVGSPDGRFVARIQGICVLCAANEPIASVALRRSWQPTWTNVYVGYGYYQESGPVGPYVHWADNSHLIVDYQKASDVPTSCIKRVQDIVIECREHTW
jgi:hypothetical protein